MKLCAVNMVSMGLVVVVIFSVGSNGVGAMRRSWTVVVAAPVRQLR